MTSKLIWLTDLHMLPKGQQPPGRDPALMVGKAIDTILAHHRDAAASVISGDLSDDSSGASYRRLAPMLARLPMPVLLLTGNHDNRAALREVFALSVPPERPTLDHVMDLPDVRLLCLDTLHPGLNSGILTDDQLRWLADELAAANGKPALIFMHHPPVALGLPLQDLDRLANGAAFLAVVKAAPSPVHICFGHVHRAVSGSVDGIPFSGMGSVLYQAPLPYPAWTWETYAPTEEPSMLGIVLVGGSGVVIHYHQIAS